VFRASRVIQAQPELLAQLDLKALRVIKGTRVTQEAKALKVFKVQQDQLALSELPVLLVSTGVALGVVTLTMLTTMLFTTTTHLGLLQATLLKVKPQP
jgi:hypothetical protein